MTLVNCNHNSVSVICGVTWCVFALLLSYHKNGFDINCVKPWIFFCKFYVINKVQLRCSIFSMKTSSKLVPSAGELVWGNFLVSFLCLLLFSISSISSRDVFRFCEIWSAAFVLRLPFIAVYWYSTQCSQCFSKSKFSPSLSSWPKLFVCIWRFFRLIVLVFGFWFFFLSGFSFTDTDDSQASRGR